MKTYCATVTVLAMTLLVSICTLAQERPEAVPGTANVDAPLPSGMSPQAERQAVAAEQAKVPIGGIFGMASDRDAEGNAVRITSASVHIENGQPVWYLGGFGRCGGAVPPPKQQAALRGYIAKYTTADVRFEKGGLFSTTPVHIKGCH